MKNKTFLSLLAIPALALGLAASAHAQTFTVDFTKPSPAVANAGDTWGFDFEIDAVGNISVAPTDDFVTAHDGSVTVSGSTTDPALFNTTFDVALVPANAAGTITGEFGLHVNNGGWAPNTSDSAGEEFRLTDDESVVFDWDLTGLPGTHTLQLTGMSSDFVNAAGSFNYNGSGSVATPNGSPTNFADLSSITSVLAGGTNPGSNRLGVNSDTDIRLDRWQFEIVPEPGTFALTAIGLAAIAFRRRRRVS